MYAIIMYEYINKIRRKLRDVYGLVPTGGTEREPIFDNIPDGDYSIVIDGRLDFIVIKDNQISCCNFDPVPPESNADTPTKQVIKAKQIGMFRDGGTTVYADANGTKYYSDYRIGSQTRGEIFDRHPREQGALILNVIIDEID